MPRGPRREPEQPQLFDTTPYEKPEPRMDYDPEAWLSQPDITFHGSYDAQMPQEDPHRRFKYYGPNFHSGTLKSAMDRSDVRSPGFNDTDVPQRAFIHPIRLEGEMAINTTPDNPREEKRRGNQPRDEKRPMLFTDNEANYRPSEDYPDFVPPSEAARDVPVHLAEGRHVPYANYAEDAGSVSFRSPRSGIRSWAEDVLSDPGASTHHRNLAEQFDLTIPVQDNWTPHISQARIPLNIKGIPEMLGRVDPTRMSGEIHEQPSLFEGEESQISGSTPLHVTKPKLVKKVHTVRRVD